jgi:hypothetical protein
VHSLILLMREIAAVEYAHQQYEEALEWADKACAKLEAVGSIFEPRAYEELREALVKVLRPALSSLRQVQISGRPLLSATAKDEVTRQLRTPK